MAKEKEVHCLSSTCKNAHTCPKQTKPLYEIMKDGGKIVSQMKECYVGVQR